jgi:beta-glucanase (GH16 family)
MATGVDLTGYKLTFDDEFNGFSWAGNGGTWKTLFYFGGRSLPSNGELEYYSDPSVGVNPFSIQNGALDIVAAPSANTAATGGLPYTSGLITTEGTFAQTYGYFEMRAMLPAGQGMWPAFWLLPTDKSWPPELDVLEAFGAPNANHEGGPTQFHLGTISSNGAQNFGTWIDTGVDLTQGYHTFGLLWDAQHLSYFFDGRQVAQTATPADMNKPMYMLANLAVGGNWVGPPAGETAHLDIDYIRAYSSDPNAVAVSPQTISAPDGAADAFNVPSSPPPAPTSTLHLRVAEDAFNGDAQFTVMADGKQIGGVFTATTLHSSGGWQDITVSGDMGANGPSKVQVNFVNDAWGGSAATDRNLYIQSIEVNGHTFLGTAATNNATNGTPASDSAAMNVNGTVTFTTAGSPPIVAVTPVIVTPDAQPTPDEPRTTILPDRSGTARGTSGADDIFATGKHQTLVGNGGDDIFEIGTHTDAKILVGSTGITTVKTAASSYTLANGVDDLWVSGTAAHNVAGNARNNWIHASDGNDTISSGAGNDTIVTGSGTYKLTGGSGTDLFVFTQPTSQNSHVTDFTVGQDMVDLRPLMQAINYAGSDPLADHTVQLIAGGSGYATITLDRHDGQGAHAVVTLDHVAPTALTAGADWVFR